MNTMRKRPYNNNRNNNSGGGRHRRSGGGGRYNSGQSLARQKQTALQKKENYLNQARDALSSGDRVQAEWYFQHVEHWARVVGEILEQLNERDDSQQDDSNNDAVDGNATESDDNDDDLEAKDDSKSDNSDDDQEEKPRARRGRKPKIIKDKKANPNANHDETPLPDSMLPQATAK